MSINENDILIGLNKIFAFLGPYGGKITIDSDWDFYCKVYNFNGFIYKGNNHIAIDCGCSIPGGRLAAICLDTMEEYYV